jgi:NADH-quinone oxidoreductase subunit C
MSFDEIKLLLTEKFGEAVVTGEERTGMHPALFIDADRIADVCLIVCSWF